MSDAAESASKPSEVRKDKKRKAKRPKKCDECKVGKVAAKIDRKNKVYWLCRTCTIELQDVFDKYGTIHKGELPPLDVHDDEDEGEAKEQVEAIATQYKLRIGKEVNQDIEDVRDHIDTLFAVCGFEQGYPWNGFDFEFNFLEFSSALISAKLNFRSAIWPGNMDKNRYANVLPPESSRIILSTLKDPETGKPIPDTDFVNGCHLDGISPGAKNRYLGVQGPLDTTMSDFWRLMWEQNATLVVMVTREVESDRAKCARYWPEEEVENTYGQFLVRMEEMVTKHDIIRRRFTMIHLKSGSERCVWHLQYIEWPDHGVPATAHVFLELVDMVDDPMYNPSGGPIVVHCSAGIGRTGTFCTVHTIIEKYRQDKEKGVKKPKVNVLSTILHFRKQRPGMVQTKDQMIFCYTSVLEWWDRQTGEERIMYALADYETTDELEGDDQAAFQLDFRAGDKLRIIHRREDGWCKAENQWNEVGYVSVYYMDPFRFADDYPGETIPSVLNDTIDHSKPRKGVRNPFAQPEAVADAAGANGGVSLTEQMLEDEAHMESVWSTPGAEDVAKRIVGTWSARKTQMNNDAPRNAMMSNIKQLRSDGEFLAHIMDNVAKGRYRIDEPSPNQFVLVTVERSRKLVEELVIEKLDETELIVSSNEDPDFRVKIYYERTGATGEEEIDESMGPVKKVKKKTME